MDNNKDSDFAKTILMYCTHKKCVINNKLLAKSQI